MTEGTRLLTAGAMLGAVLLFSAPRSSSVDRRLDAAPLVATSLNLAPVFASNGNTADRTRHAGDACRIFSIAAEGVEWDGRQPLTERSFVEGRQVDQHIVTVRKFFSHEWKFRDAYPQFGTAVSEHLKARLGEHLTGGLTDDARRQWALALREVESACAAVEGGRS